MVIELRDLDFSYADDASDSVLQIKHWAVAKNQHSFLCGPSGSGKSTLLNIVSGLQTAYNGEVSVLGQRLDALSNRGLDQFRATHIGYVFQQFNLIPYLSALDNIQLASEFSMGQVKKNVLEDSRHLLSALNIDDAHWKKPVSMLSIGQQQRVAIARALINKPALLIADEPTSSLDDYHRDVFMSLLMTLIKENNTTLLFVSHDKSLASYFQRVQSLSELNTPYERHRCL